jgi:hypothetical protein
MDKIKDLFNMVVDSPNMVNSKLPWNSWNSCIEESENSIAGWLGKIFSVGAFLLLIGILYGNLNPLWNGGFKGADAVGVIGILIGMLLWTYAAFPISKIVRNVGDNLGSSKSGIIHLIFLDLPLSFIKVAGYVLAMVGLFTAIGATLSFVTSIDIVGGLGKMTEGLAEMASMGTTALFGILSDSPVYAIGDAMNQILNPDLGMFGYGGEAWTIAGAMGVFAAFIGVLLTLINLYINIVIYKFFFGLISTLVNWIKGPYLPFKSL